MKSITARLSIGVILIVALFWLSAAAITRNVFAHEIDEILAQNMQGTASRLLQTSKRALTSSTEHDGDNDHEVDDDLSIFDTDRSDFLAFVVKDASGNLVLRSAGADQLITGTRERTGLYVESGTVFYTTRDTQSGLAITVASTNSYRNVALSEATWALLWPLIGLMLLLMFITIFVIRWLLRPLDELGAAVSKRSGSDLSPIDTAGMSPELRPIAGSVNALMQRLQGAMDAERSFAATSAHELRTPIAGALAQVQQLRSEIGAGKGSKRAAAIETALKQLAHLATRLLQLARADASLGQEEQRHNLRPVVDAVVQEFTDRATAPLNITVEDHLLQAMMVQMDPDAFALILRNLIENAERHGDPASQITVYLGQDWSVSVKNHGPVVPAEVLPDLKERFKRGQSDAFGTGLGLAIADKLAVQSGGKLLLHSPATGFEDGFEGQLKLP